MNKSFRRECRVRLKRRLGAHDRWTMEARGVLLQEKALNPQTRVLDGHGQMVYLRSPLVIPGHVKLVANVHVFGLPGCGAGIEFDLSDELFGRLERVGPIEDCEALEYLHAAQNQDHQGDDDGEPEHD